MSDRLETIAASFDAEMAKLEEQQRKLRERKERRRQQAKLQELGSNTTTTTTATPKRTSPKPTFTTTAKGMTDPKGVLSPAQSSRGSKEQVTPIVDTSVPYKRPSGTLVNDEPEYSSDAANNTDGLEFKQKDSIATIASSSASSLTEANHSTAAADEDAGVAKSAAAATATKKAQAAHVAAVAVSSEEKDLEERMRRRQERQRKRKEELEALEQAMDKASTRTTVTSSSVSSSVTAIFASNDSGTGVIASSSVTRTSISEDRASLSQTSSRTGSSSSMKRVTFAEEVQENVFVAQTPLASHNASILDEKDEPLDDSLLTMANTASVIDEDMDMDMDDDLDGLLEAALGEVGDLSALASELDGILDLSADARDACDDSLGLSTSPKSGARESAVDIRPVVHEQLRRVPEYEASSSDKSTGEGVPESIAARATLNSVQIASSGAEAAANTADIPWGAELKQKSSKAAQDKAAQNAELEAQVAHIEDADERARALRQLKRKKQRAVLSCKLERVDDSRARSLDTLASKPEAPTSKSLSKEVRTAAPDNAPSAVNATYSNTVHRTDLSMVDEMSSLWDEVAADLEQAGDMDALLADVLGDAKEETASTEEEKATPSSEHKPTLSKTEVGSVSTIADEEKGKPTASEPSTLTSASVKPAAKPAKVAPKPQPKPKTLPPVAAKVKAKTPPPVAKKSKTPPLVAPKSKTPPPIASKAKAQPSPPSVTSSDKTATAKSVVAGVLTPKAMAPSSSRASGVAAPPKRTSGVVMLAGVTSTESDVDAIKPSGPLLSSSAQKQRIVLAAQRQARPSSQFKHNAQGQERMRRHTMDPGALLNRKEKGARGAETVSQAAKAATRKAKAADMATKFGGHSLGFMMNQQAVAGRSRLKSRSETAKATCLYQVKGKQQPLVLRIPLKYSSLNACDAFVLDTSDAVFVWYGPTASRKERFAAKALAININDLEHSGRAKVHEVEGDEIRGESKGANAFKGSLLGDAGEIQQTEEDDASFEKAALQQIRLLDVSADCEPIEVARGGDVQRRLLQSDGAFLLDSGVANDAVYLYLGPQCSAATKSKGRVALKAFTEQHPTRPGVTVRAGTEQAAFRSKFVKWEDGPNLGVAAARNPVPLESLAFRARALTASGTIAANTRSTVAVGATSTGTARGDRSTFYSVVDLKTMVSNSSLPSDIDMKFIEDALDESAFEEAFGVTFSKFCALPNWKKQNLRKKAFGI
eukprot:m.198790 g.198790  ORF g.198790 m.198790 type:complete len:1222 (+) comp14925_c1_seq1:104-3769(+)